MFIELKL